METIQIKSGQGDYTVDFISDLTHLVDNIQITSKSIVVIDRNVSRLYSKLVRPLKKIYPVIEIDATEEEKSFVGVSKVLTYMQEQNITKRNIMIAIGGGIIEDIAAFVAHIYYRGIKWIYVPTTLLAMCDSCIGAKVGINFNDYKNQLGFFHSPIKVLVYTGFIDTLKDSDISSGYGEILKLSLTGPNLFFNELKSALSKDGLKNYSVDGFIYKSLKIKKHYVEIDEYDNGERRKLNYGHTFGHALETITNYEIPHGLAIVWGMDLANWISLKSGLLKKNHFQTVNEVIRNYFIFPTVLKIDTQKLFDHMKHDKKVQGNTVNLILLEKPGVLKIDPTKIDNNLYSVVDDYMEAFYSSNDK